MPANPAYMQSLPPVGGVSRSVSQRLACLPSGRCCSVLGLRIHELDYDSAIAQISHWTDAQEPRYVCISAVHTVMEAYDSPDFRAAANEADLVGADGVPVIWVCRWLGLTHQKRVFAPELTVRLCEMAAEAGIPVGFYGSTQTVNDDLTRKMRERFPDLNVAYARPSVFRDLSNQEIEAIAAEINDAGTRILFVGLGCPRQEHWMRRARPHVKAVMLGVGWAFDVCSGHSRAAPAWMQEIGMEWFWRLLENPRKLWRRFLKNNPRFVLLALAQSLGIIRYQVPVDRPPSSGPH